jgi:hypothetical protein
MSDAVSSACPNCGGQDLYVSLHPINAGGGYAPDLLPGLHSWFKSGKMRALLCAGCGYYRQFADADACARLSNSAKWRKL